MSLKLIPSNILRGISCLPQVNGHNDNTRPCVGLIVSVPITIILEVRKINFDDSVCRKLDILSNYAQR